MYIYNAEMINFYTYQKQIAVRQDFLSREGRTVLINRSSLVPRLFSLGVDYATNRLVKITPEDFGESYHYEGC